MGFLDKITGNDISREFKVFEERVNKLPKDYKDTWEEIEKNLWQYSDFTGRNLISIFDNILDMFEEASINGKRVQEILGNDIKGFCLELVREEGENTFRDKWRKELNKKISKKLSK